MNHHSTPVSKSKVVAKRKAPETPKSSIKPDVQHSQANTSSSSSSSSSYEVINKLPRLIISSSKRVVLSQEFKSSALSIESVSNGKQFNILLERYGEEISREMEAYPKGEDFRRFVSMMIYDVQLILRNIKVNNDSVNVSIQLHHLRLKYHRAGHFMLHSMIASSPRPPHEFLIPSDNKDKLGNGEVETNFSNYLNAVTSITNKVFDFAFQITARP